MVINFLWGTELQGPNLVCDQDSEHTDLGKNNPIILCGQNNIQNTACYSKSLLKKGFDKCKCWKSCSMKLKEISFTDCLIQNGYKLPRILMS